MKKFIGAGLLVLSPFLTRAWADDIEIYFSVGAETTPYVMLMLDAAPETFRPARCADLSGCQAVLTSRAFTALTEFRDGDSTCGSDGVTTWEVYRAVLASVLSETTPSGALKYADINLGLMASNQKSHPGANIMQGFERLGSGGLESIIRDLGAIPCEIGSGDFAHDFTLSDMYLELYSYLNGWKVQAGRETSDNFLGGIPVDPDFDPNTMEMPLPSFGDDTDYVSPFSPGACPQLFSIITTINGNNYGNDNSITSAVKAEFQSQMGGGFLVGY